MKTVYLVTYRRAKDGALAARIVTEGLAIAPGEDLRTELAYRCGANPGDVLSVCEIENCRDVYAAWRDYYMRRRTIWEGAAYMDYQPRA